MRFIYPMRHDWAMRETTSLVPVGDTELYVVDRGTGYPILLLHGGPGLDHHEFGDYLDPLCDEYRLLLIDQRGQGRSGRATRETWNLPQMARDIDALAESISLDRYAVLGHSYGAFVALQHAVDSPGRAAQTIVSSGVPSARFLAQVDDNLAAFEPIELRTQVSDSWAREVNVATREEFAQLMADQMPFHFSDPMDPRIEEYNRRTSATLFSPDILKHFAAGDYGGIEVENRLRDIPQPVLILAGRHDRTCPVVAAESMSRHITKSELVIFEHSAHMTFVEENERYLDAIRSFLGLHRA